MGDTTRSLNQPGLAAVRPITGGPLSGDQGGIRTAEQNRLMELSDNQRLFLDWLTGDRPEGEGQNEFGRRVGIEGWQLSKWKRDPAFLAAWEKRMLRTHGNPQILSDQMATLREIIQNGRNESDRIKAVDLYWKLCEKMAPGGVLIRPADLSERDANELTDEELEAALGAG